MVVVKLVVPEAIRMTLHFCKVCCLEFTSPVVDLTVLRITDLDPLVEDRMNGMVLHQVVIKCSKVLLVGIFEWEIQTNRNIGMAWEDNLLGQLDKE